MSPRLLAVVAACSLALTGVAAADSRDTARARLATIAKRLQDAEAREGELTDRLTRLDRQLTATERELDGIRHRYAARARAAYTSGIGGDPILVLLSAPEPAAVIGRLDLYAAATRADDALLRHGAVLRRRLTAQRAEVADARKEIDAIRKSLQADGAEVRTLLDRLSRAERSRTPRASRAARLTGRYACLVGPVHAFSSTWGAPRSGGRSHKGTDVFAPYGSPSYAVTDGVIRRLSTSYNGGLQVYLKADDGNEYFYAHMSSYASHTGQRVHAGDVIAYVGDSGNARGGPAHVHFEVHPGGGAPVNPYPYVKRFCG